MCSFRTSSFFGFHCCPSLPFPSLSLLVRGPLPFLRHPRSDICRGAQHGNSHRLARIQKSNGSTSTRSTSSGSEKLGLYEQVAIPADSFARTVVFAMSQPDEVDINEMLFRPTRQEY